MGGSEGARGYLYQSIASIIRAFTLPDWDKIYVEYNSPNDKVDIGFESEQTLIRSIQVKSSINCFSAYNLCKWLNDLIADVPAESYELFLIGNCNDGAQTLIKSVEKYYSDVLDSEAKDCLCKNKIDTPFLDNHSVKLTVLPYNIQVLRDIAVASVHQFLSSSQIHLNYECLCFIVDGMISKHMELSIAPGGCDREAFEAGLHARVNLLKQEFVASKRIPLSIRSFSRGSTTLERLNEDHMLNLESMFEGRFIRESMEWKRDIIPVISDFLLSKTNPGSCYALLMDTHSSIAFAAGRSMDSKTGIDIVPMQKTSKGMVIWEKHAQDTSYGPPLTCDIQVLPESTPDVAAVFSVTHNIKEDVLSFITDQKLSVGRLFHFSLSIDEQCNCSIRSGAHCLSLASTAQRYIHQRSTDEKKGVLHIFCAAPNGFMFFLGQLSRGFGRCQIYDHDFEKETVHTYFPTMKF